MPYKKLMRMLVFMRMFVCMSVFMMMLNIRLGRLNARRGFNALLMFINGRMLVAMLMIMASFDNRHGLDGNTILINHQSA